MMFKKQVIFILLLLFYSFSLFAANYYVTNTGNTSNSGNSWSTPITLDTAIDKAADGDVIHVSQGEYKPTKKLSGGNLTEDICFEINKNITIIGGYPANPVPGSKADKSNTTLLNGNHSGTNSFHVVAITAAINSDKYVRLKNLTISGGQAGESASGSVSVSGLSFNRYNGGGIIIGNSAVELDSCDIINNKSNHHTPGIYAFANAFVNLNYCTISDNIGETNGGALWNDASTVTLNNCIIANNKIGGVGAAIYAFNAKSTSKTYIYNTTISHNEAGHKAGYYGRENSIGLMINCTVYGNVTERLGGGGIALYAGATAATAAKFDIISSTISNNSTKTNEGDGIWLNDQFCDLGVYNTVISGNNQDVSLLNGASYFKRNSIVGTQVFGENGQLISGKFFDPVTMIGDLEDNGGFTKTCLLLGGANNPALEYGMTRTELLALESVFEPDFPTTDVGQRLFKGTNLIRNVLAEESYTVTEGVKVSEISFESTNALRTKVFVFEIDLTNPNISIVAATPNNGTAFLRQKMTQQAVYIDGNKRRVQGGINGDFFDMSNGIPRSILYKNGVGVKTEFQDASRTFFAITKNKEAIVGDQTTYPAVKNNILEAVGGRYWLVKDGDIYKVNDTSLEPRTCVGVSEDKKTVYFLAVDGRQENHSNGMSFQELSQCLIALGSYTGVNLDGGGSTTFFVRNSSGKFIIRNKPSDAAGERAVANGLVIVSTP